MAAVRSVPERLRDAAKLFEERNKSYGANYVHFGRALLAMFPDGLHATTEEEMQRVVLFCLQLTKITRYARNLNKGGHADSAQDGAVYWLMMDEQDELHAQKAKSENVVENSGQKLDQAKIALGVGIEPLEAQTPDEWWTNRPDFFKRFAKDVGSNPNKIGSS